MSNESSFVYHQKPKFNIGDEVLMVCDVHEVTEHAESLIFKGRINWIRGVVEVTAGVGSYDEQFQDCSFSYYIDIDEESLDRRSAQDNLFSLDEIDKAKALADKWLNDAIEKHKARAALLQKLSGKNL